MTGQPAAIDLTRRESFKLFTPVTIRFCDTDKLGHINNVSITSYFEAGRCELYYRLITAAGQAVRDEIDFVLARITIDFRRELHYPGTVEIASRLTRVGTKSVTSGYAAFIGAECFATAEAVNVFFDPKARRSLVPPPSLRTLLEQEVAAPGAGMGIA